MDEGQEQKVEGVAGKEVNLSFQESFVKFPVDSSTLIIEYWRLECYDNETRRCIYEMLRKRNV